ncbi:hypothetical protein [Nocardioides sp. T2.26MG-1]|uniref:hypothetical protein n=1 Tax=Nocardioides sp. T2.26MG-1 TaxID=3041166 RepID=UPI002477A051|nr:hypothetical protein [Nocardioides sp. T2.26MG-1]CAI9415585.1 hypothetical protein HIDPHFAB_02559 [Nocardioides sp. T2.26MG-1]
MNTLDDLRTILEREAAFDDTERHVRPAAVRQRVRTVRRRRAGAVAMAAAVMLVAATAGVGVLRSPSSPEPAETLEDVQVPQRIDVYGFPYKLASTHRVAGDGTVVLDPAPEGPTAVRLVSTGLGSGEATLWSGYYPVARVRGGEQVSPATTGVGASGLRVEFVGTPDVAEAEVAVYEPTGELAPGISSDGVVFRQQYAGHELVAAAFSRGADDARISAPEDLAGLETSAYCRSSTPGLWLHQDGLTAGATPCEDLDAGADPGPANESALAPPRSGDGSMAVYVTQGEDGPRAAGVDVLFGLALYRETVAPTRVLGTDVPPVLEQAGRTWQLTDVVRWDGSDFYEVDTSDDDALVAAAYVGATGGFLSWHGAPEGGWVGSNASGQASDSPSVMYAPVLLSGDHTVQLHLEGPDAQGRLLVYRPV